MGSMEVKKDKNSEEKGKLIWWAIGVKNNGRKGILGKWKILEQRNLEIGNFRNWKNGNKEKRKWKKEDSGNKVIKQVRKYEII